MNSLQPIFVCQSAQIFCDNTDMLTMVWQGHYLRFRSSPGDTAILLAVHLNLYVPIDNGTGKCRKLFDVRKSDLTGKRRKALLGIHPYVCMYVYFSHKSKLHLMIKTKQKRINLQEY